MARLLLALLLLLPLAASVRAADSTMETQLRYLEKDLDRLREEVKALPEARRLDRLEAEIAGLRAAIKAAEKSAEDAVKEKLEAQEKRIGDLSLVLAEGANEIAASSSAISSASNATSWIVGIGAILLTAGLFGVGLYSVLKVPEQSRLAAEQIIKDYLRSTDAKRDFHSSVETLLGSEIAAIQALAKRGDRLPSSQSDEPAPLPSPETEQALLKVSAMPAHDRTIEQWRALIISLTDQKAYEAALTVINEWLNLPTIKRESVARALLLRGWVFSQGQRPREIISLYGAIINRFDNPPSFQKLGHPGNSVELRRIDEIAVYDEITLRFGADPTPALRETVARALANKALALCAITPPELENSLLTCSDLIDHFGGDPAPELHIPIARALANKALVLSLLTPPQWENSLAASEEVIRRFRGEANSDVRVAVAGGLISKILALCALKRPKEGYAAYEDYQKLFTDASEPAIQILTANIRNHFAA